MFKNAKGCGPEKSSFPLPSVVPETLSGPGLRVEGSHVNRYGRAAGTLSGIGLVGLEELEETSDMEIFNGAYSQNRSSDVDERLGLGREGGRAPWEWRSLQEIAVPCQKIVNHVVN